MILAMPDGWLEYKAEQMAKRKVIPRELLEIAPIDVDYSSKLAICLDEYQKVCRVCTVPLPSTKVKTFWQRAWEFLKANAPSEADGPMGF